MTTVDLLPGLTLIFRKVFDNDTLVPTPEMVAADVDGWDSLAFTRLLVAIEERYCIEFTWDEVVGFKNVGALVDGIKSKLGAAPEGGA